MQETVGIHSQQVVLSVRNVAGQLEREVLIERIFEDGRERQTTCRVTGYTTDTSEAHGWRALPLEEAREIIAEAEAKFMLAKQFAGPATRVSEGVELLMDREDIEARIVHIQATGFLDDGEELTRLRAHVAKRDDRFAEERARA